jgi:hypothetical protein
MSETSYALDVLLTGKGVSCGACKKAIQDNQLPVITTPSMISNYHAFRIEQIPSVHNPDRAVIMPLCEYRRGTLLPWQVGNVAYVFQTDLIVAALADAGLDAEQVQVKSNYVGVSLRELAADW